MRPRRLNPRRWPALAARWLTAAVVTLALSAGAASRLDPAGELARQLVPLAGIAIFLLSYLGLAMDRLPGLAIDRAGIALVGAALMVASGAIPLTAAYQAVNLDTLLLVLGMMIVVANLQLSGFFALAGAWAMRRAHHPLSLLATIILLSGCFSAFLLNDAVCLVLTPLVLRLTQALRRDPLPYLLAVAMAANVGSTATITGNPQNMIIGSLSGLSYRHFAAELAPVALAGLVLSFMLIAWLHRHEFAATPQLSAELPPVRLHRMLAWRALAGCLLLAVLFLAGQPPAAAALLVGGLLLLTRRVRSERIYAHIDWSLLLMFAGLFVIVAGAGRTLLNSDAMTAATALHLDRTPLLAAVTALLSNLVSNVPAVLVMQPFVETQSNPQQAWLTVAMASTLAGNLTTIGSIANLIVVRAAAGGGVRIGFLAYCRVGVPLTLLSLTAGTVWLER